LFGLVLTISLILLQSTIMNLTLELNQTEPLPPGRLQEVTGVLVSLEMTAEQNQQEVDMLTDQVW
jgi:hypothetical protein